jgi:hypothetical protein
VVELKGRGTYSSALAADRGGRFDFWNLGALIRSYSRDIPRTLYSASGDIYDTR